MADNPFTDTASKATRLTTDRQGRNQAWWNTKPMTYADWAAESRVPQTDQDILDIQEYVLRTGPWLRDWFENLHIKNQTCLDLGSGSGIFSSFLARRGARVIAIELTEAGVALTRRTTSFFNSGVHVVRGDAECLPFAPETFDFIFSWGVLHHTSDMDAAIGQMGQALKSGGRGMMMVYHKASIVYYVHGLYWLIARGKILSGHNLQSVQSYYTDGFYHRYLTKSDLRDKLAAAGLVVSSFHITQYEKKILPFIPDWLDRALKKRFGMCLVAEFEKPVESRSP